MSLFQYLKLSQAQWEAASLVSPPCPSCSVTQKITVAMPLVMTTHTGCLLTLLCQPTWSLSQKIGWHPTSAGASTHTVYLYPLCIQGTHKNGFLQYMSK